MKQKQGITDTNGNKVFKTITNDEIYNELMDLKEMTKTFVDAHKQHLEQDSKVFKAIWAVIGTMIITFISFLFIFVK